MKYYYTEKHIKAGDHDVTLTTLGDGEIEVVVSTVGGGLRGIYLPYEGGKRNIVLRYDSEEQYLSNISFAGAVLCPNAGNIEEGELTIKGRTYQLTKNVRGVSNLHGGFNGTAFRNWELKDSTACEDAASVTMTTELPDGTDGFPGNRNVSITYTLRDKKLAVEICADTDADTYLNTTMHPYFNLNGDASTCALDNILMIDADRAIRNDDNNFPREMIPVEGTAFDLRKGCALQEIFDRYPEDPDIVRTKGYNNAFILNPYSEDKPQLSMYSRATKLGVDITTNAPVIFVCSAAFMPKGTLENGIPTSPSCGVAIECQDYPDAPHFLGDKMTVTGPGEVSKREIYIALRY